jgi:2-oxo-4-hydroxy-4-carboxy-5-ureidoimidazoline decarboxylase
LIKAHPDLAGRAAIAGELTEASNEEQASAGIDQCSPEEFARFQDLNERYKAKFDFPFVMAVRKSNRHEILVAFETRLSNDPDDEFEQAIAEIHKIARLRLAAEEQQ